MFQFDVNLVGMEGEAPMTNGYSNGVESTGGAEVSDNLQTPDAKKHSSSSSSHGHHSSSKDKHKHSSSKVRQIIMSRGGGSGQSLGRWGGYLGPDRHLFSVTGTPVLDLVRGHPRLFELYAGRLFPLTFLCTEEFGWGFRRIGM